MESETPGGHQVFLVDGGCPLREGPSGRPGRGPGGGRGCGRSPVGAGRESDLRGDRTDAVELSGRAPGAGRPGRPTRRLLRLCGLGRVILGDLAAHLGRAELPEPCQLLEDLRRLSEGASRSLTHWPEVHQHEPAVAATARRARRMDSPPSVALRERLCFPDREADLVGRVTHSD